MLWLVLASAVSAAAGAAAPASAAVAVEPALADGRAWQMVSPPNKDGALIEAITHDGGIVQASAEGGAISYLADAPILENPDEDPAGNSNLTQVLSRRGAGGWSSLDIAPPHEAATGQSVGLGQEYRFFSSDLESALVEPRGETPLAPEANERTIYLRNNSGGAYLPLVTAANVLPGTKFANQIEFVSATPDLRHVILRSAEAALTSGAAESGLYEWAGGALSLVGVLPDGTASPGATLGEAGLDVRHAISDDGRRVFWSAEGHLYVRDTLTPETVQADAAQGVAEPATAGARFQSASSDGSRVFFIDGNQLTPDSTATGPEGADIYEFDTGSGKLTDLTVDANLGESATALAALPGASEDGSYLYFVARGVLAPGAQSGAANLYVLHEEGGDWTTSFIAGLSSEDLPDWEGREGNNGQNLGEVSTRVSPNGRYLAFMSNNSLTGYDNVDASPEAKGARDEEVFLFDATRPLSAQNPICASCNPSGSPPRGVFDSGQGAGLLVDRREAWSGHWLAGSLPGWTSVNLSYAIYQSRYLSDSGRLFFNSPDTLVPQDINGSEDVYQYEPGGVGSCAGADGCLALTSSGTASDESAFLDASTGGNDVFFLSAAQLLPQDIDGSFDVYDAQVCSPAVPCIAPPAAPPAACATGESCRPAASPQPTIFGAPASAGFSGAGNLPPKPVAQLTRAQRLQKALQACKKVRKRRRAACRSRARRAYGARSAKAHGKRVGRRP